MTRGFATAPRASQLLALALGVGLLALYLSLPDVDERPSTGDNRADSADEPDRPEILDVSPASPYPGSSVRVRYAGVTDGESVGVFAGKSALRVLAQRPGEVVASLPPELEPGDLKIKLSLGAASDQPRVAVRSKAYHLHVRAPDYRKVYRNLLGGLALLGMGLHLLARGVRESTGLDAARAATRVASVSSVAYGLGALLGALMQATTGAAGALLALTSSGVLPLASAGLAFLGAQLGAAVAPLVVTGFMEPREGLLVVAIGTLWMKLARDRRASALARLALGVGFLAFGLQLLRPAVEPFVSDPLLVALAERLRADTVLDVALCAVVGTTLVALLQGPAALVVIMLTVAQTTGRWDLTTALALLSGTGLGASIATLLTAPVGSQARLLVRLHLSLGAASTLLSASTVSVWSGLALRMLGLHESSPMEMHAPLHELGLPLALALTLSLLACAIVLAPFVKPLAAWLMRRELGHSKLVRAQRHASERARAHAHETVLLRVLDLHQRGLDTIARLVRTGSRNFGGSAEHSLADARALLEQLVEGQLSGEIGASESVNDGATFAFLQLHHALEALLVRAEQATEARLQQAEESGETPWQHERVLCELHELVSGGLSAAYADLRQQRAPDLDQARSREIRINRIELRTRHASRVASVSEPSIERHLSLLQVVDGYEVVGNQLYRLTEALERGCAVLPRWDALSGASR